MKSVLTSIIILIVLSITGPVSVNAMNISVYVPEKYMEVDTGERLYFEIAIKYPENNRRKDLKLFYIIKKTDGTQIMQTKVLRAIETQASFLDFVIIPNNIKSGTYILDVVIEDYDYLHKEVSTTFSVISDRDNVYLLTGVITIGILLFGILLILWQILLARLQWRDTIKKKHEYTFIPAPERIYYEMISSAIVQMKERVGIRAVILAQEIYGMSVSNTGRVNSIYRDPADILAELVILYKKEFGKDVSFAIR